MIWGLLALVIAAAFAMQASLAVLGGISGALAWWASRDGLWLAGAIVLVANWPFTLLVIMPTNLRLMATAPDSADAATRSLLEQWGRLHAVRSVLGAIATLLFLLAAFRIGR